MRYAFRVRCTFAAVLRADDWERAEIVRDLAIELENLPQTI
jgi:hypothetical protein